jgi:hypothetical protein
MSRFRSPYDRCSRRSPRFIAEFCAEHLDEEYAQVGHRLAAKLARKRPSPLLRGDRRIWAAGIAYAVGQVDFLSESERAAASADRRSG